MKFKFLTGDVNWKEYGGKFVSPKQNNGDWNYWLVIDVINMHDVTGDETEPKYYITISAVAPDAVSEDEKNSALQSCDMEDWYKKTDWKDLTMVEALVTCGISACLWQAQGNNIRKLMQDARKESDQIVMLFGFYMDRQLNAIGNDGWDFISGNIGLK